MTGGPWSYPRDLAEALATFGLAPRSDTPPVLAREALSDLYRHEIRRLRERLLAGLVARADYRGLVIELRKKYWPLSLTPEAWERICSGT